MELDYKKNFEKNRYVIIKDFFDRKHVDRIKNRLHLLQKSNLTTVDKQCPKSHSIYSDTVVAEIQEIYRMKLENAIEYSLYPTYSYSRIYQPKEVLERHRDRESCEISVTSTISYDTYDNEPWDIFVEPNKQIKLYPGDALIYKGCEIDHWRESFVGLYQTQIFLHYVNANGPYADCKYDFRPSLSSSVDTRNTEQLYMFMEKLKIENNSKQEAI